MVGWRWACSVRDAALPRVVSASIVEEIVGSAYLIGMKADEIRDLCYAHGFDLVDVEPVKDVFLVSLGVVNDGEDCVRWQNS